MPQSLQDIESHNLEVVARFCEAWETRQLEHMLPLLSEHIHYKMWDAEDAIVVEGKAQFAETLGPFLAGTERVEFTVLRSHAMGKVVINERHDRFVFDSGDEWFFPIVGVFVLEDGLIVSWKDYVTPTKQSRM